MANDLMMRVKDQVMIVFADYAGCHTDYNWEWEHEAPRVAKEIAKRIMDNYAILAQCSRTKQFVTKAEAEIEALVHENARLKHDPWAMCRSTGDLIRAGYAVARIIERHAGAGHKFSVWSATVITSRAKYGKDLSVIVAAPSLKTAVDYVNRALESRENLGWAQQHWSGGGTIGDQIATKRGVWIGKEKSGHHNGPEDYKLIWEPK